MESPSLLEGHKGGVSVGFSIGGGWGELTINTGSQVSQLWTNSERRKLKEERVVGLDDIAHGSLASRVHVISSDLFELPNTNTC